MGRKKLFKVCTKCRRRLTVDNFGKDSSSKDGYSYRCKECQSADKKAFYDKNRKVKDGIKMGKDGRLIVHEGFACKIFWNPTQIKFLKDNYADMSNADLAIEIGVSIRTICRKAKELGLKKSEEFMERTRNKGLKVCQLVNKVRRKVNPAFIEAGEATRFQKGHKPPTMTTEERHMAGKRASVVKKINADRVKQGLPKLNKRQREETYRLYQV